MKTKLKLNITCLYPKEMSTYGDRGNILALVQRCKWRDIEIEIAEVGLKEKLPQDFSDIYLFGGGQDLAQVQVSQDLETKKEFLKKEAEAGKVFLGICGGYQLFGHYYTDGSGQKIAGLGILDVTTTAGKTRMMGNLLVETSFLKERLVGFENHSGKTVLGEKSHHFGKVIVGYGNNGEDKSEGAIQNNVYGCYLHGPVLPKNPNFADYLIKLALQKKYGNLDLKFINDTQEFIAHEVAVQRALKTH